MTFRGTTDQTCYGNPMGIRAFALSASFIPTEESTRVLKDVRYFVSWLARSIYTCSANYFTAFSSLSG